MEESSANSAAHSKAGEAEPMFDGPPSPVMYEGVLALLSEKGVSMFTLLEFSAAVTVSTV